MPDRGAARPGFEQICDVQSGGPACEFLVRGSRGCRKSPREVPYPQRDRPQDGLAHPPRVRLYTSQLGCLGNSLGALSTRLHGLVGRGFERHRERREPRDCGLSARRHCRATSENGETRFEERVKDGNFFFNPFSFHKKFTSFRWKSTARSSSGFLSSCLVASPRPCKICTNLFGSKSPG